MSRKVLHLPLLGMLLSIVMLCLSCEHRPLETMDWEENLFVRVYFNEHIRNVHFGFYDETKKKPDYSSPQAMRIVFCDEETDRVVAERYLHESGRDEQGYYIQGLVSVPNGRYNMLAYNFDTRETQIRMQNNYSAMAAYTNPLNQAEADRLFGSRSESAEEGEVICRQPEHLFVAQMEGIEVYTPSNSSHPDTLKMTQGTYPTAETIVKTYYMQVNVKGVEYVRSAVALISGMAGSTTLHDREMVQDDVVSIYFSLNNGKEKNRSKEETTVGYATFNTFGKLPHTEGYIDISFEFNTIYNTTQTESFRVTEMFDTDQVKENQWIIVDKVIEIVPPEDVETGGGMSPGVSNWEEIESSITI